MHQHVAHPPGPEPTPGLLDNLSDTLLNAFARVRKPDDRFLEMRENVDRFDDGLVLCERLWNRIRGRANGEPLLRPILLELEAKWDGLRNNCTRRRPYDRLPRSCCRCSRSRIPRIRHHGPIEPLLKHFTRVFSSVSAQGLPFDSHV